MSELSRIARIARTFARLPRGGARVSIGDDAAFLAPDLVWTIDEQVEGTHFRRDLLSWNDLGYRSFMAAASDVAAMGARPWHALTALALDPGTDSDAIAAGQAEAARAIGCGIVGGNLARSDRVAVTTTVLGKTKTPVLRSGARAGDGLWLAGPVGLAAAGLMALERGIDLPEAILAWRRPRARFVKMRGASAAIDISDGLARDAGHLARASGVRLVFDAASIVSPSLEQAAVALSTSAIELALHGGEDYAILAASAKKLPGFVRIGEVRAGRGLFLGKKRIAPRGWDHF